MSEKALAKTAGEVIYYHCLLIREQFAVVAVMRKKGLVWVVQGSYGFYKSNKSYEPYRTHKTYKIQQKKPPNEPLYCQPPTMAKISRSPIGTGTAAIGFSPARNSAISL